MQLDFSTLLPILTAFIPILLPLFPGLNQILKALPRSFWEMCVKIVGGTITWAPTVQSERGSLEARRAALLGRTYAGNANDHDERELQAVEGKLAALPKGGFLDTILALIGGGGGGSMLPILIIGGVAFMLMSGGCGGGGMSCTKKPTPVPAQPKAGPVVIDALNP